MVEALATASDILIGAGLALLPVAVVIDGALLLVATIAAERAAWREHLSCEARTQRAIRRDLYGHVDLATAWADLPDAEKRRIREQAIFREEP